MCVFSRRRVGIERGGKIDLDRVRKMDGREGGKQGEEVGMVEQQEEGEEREG